MAITGDVKGCEMRAFASRHAGTLDALNHIDYVEAFVLQLGVPAQHSSILASLATCTREFRGHKIAYKPPGTQQLTSVLDVARWVSTQLDGGLAHAHVRQGCSVCVCGGRVRRAGKGLRAA